MISKNEENTLKRLKNTFFDVVSTRLGFVLLLLLGYTLKTIWAYFMAFNLDLASVEHPVQYYLRLVLVVINPIPVGLLLIGLALYIKRKKPFYILAWTISILLTTLLFANIIYYREFADFITFSSAMASRKTSEGLGKTVLDSLQVWDLIYVIDYLIIAFLFWKKKIATDSRPFHKRASFAVTSLSALAFSINLFMAELDRPELLTRGFSNTYVVRALGLPTFSIYSTNQAIQAQKERDSASAEDLVPVKEYLSSHYAAPNQDYFGIGKGRNVIVLHLESFQQFLIDYKLKVDDKEYEVTPFINSLYHSKETFAFSNFFNQVKAGKTSDAETMMETGLFGLSNGSFMVNYGGENTQFAAPTILAQNGNYTSAVFHGNVGSFWNRNNAYKQWGYNYFFDASYFSEQTESNSFQYGLNDKTMLADSIQYLERMQQPFYTKFITVTNHYPYNSLLGNSDEQGFPLAQTNDETINGYFATANYLDSSIKALFQYLKDTGIYDNSVIVLYGDHYGISNSRNPDLAPLLGKDTETWSQYDNAMLQRVPYMVHVPGMTKGFISDTFGGEIDGLPTLLHILGIDTANYSQVGQDLLSADNKQIVALRTAGSYITPQYTSYNGRIYDTVSGLEITNPDENTTVALEDIRNAAALQLKMSDEIQTGDLLRFDKTNGLKVVNVENFSYTNSLKSLIAIEQKLGSASTSIYSKHGNKTTVDRFNAPSYLSLNPKPEESENTSETSTTTEKKD